MAMCPQPCICRRPVSGLAPLLALPSQGRHLCRGTAFRVCGQLCAGAPMWPQQALTVVTGSSLVTFQKRPQSTDFIDPLASKKPRISHFTQRAQPTLNGKLGTPNGHETMLPTLGPTPADTFSSSHLPPRLEPPRTHDPLADVSNDLGHSAQDYKHQEAAPAPAPHLGLPLLTDLTQSERPAGCSHSHSRPKKKSKKHKDRERPPEDRPPEDRPPAPQPDAPDAPAAPALLPDTPGQYHPVVSLSRWGVGCENTIGVRTWGHGLWPPACSVLGARS